MGWQRNLVDQSEEWTSTRTGVLWRIYQDGPKGHWFATWNGAPVRADRMGAGGGVRLAECGRRTWWRTVEAARLGCESFDKSLAKREEIAVEGDQ